MFAWCLGGGGGGNIILFPQEILKKFQFFKRQVKMSSYGYFSSQQCISFIYFCGKQILPRKQFFLQNEIPKAKEVVEIIICIFG